MPSISFKPAKTSICKAGVQSGAELPGDAAEDSVDMLLSFFATAQGPLRGALVYRDAKGKLAVPGGPWKSVILARREGYPTFELCNLEDDLAETESLGAGFPERVNEMSKPLDLYVARGRSTPAHPKGTTSRTSTFISFPPTGGRGLLEENSADRIRLARMRCSHRSFDSETQCGQEIQASPWLPVRSELSRRGAPDE